MSREHSGPLCSSSVFPQRTENFRTAVYTDPIAVWVFLFRRCCISERCISERTVRVSLNLDDAIVENRLVFNV